MRTPSDNHESTGFRIFYPSPDRLSEQGSDLFLNTLKRCGCTFHVHDDHKIELIASNLGLKPYRFTKSSQRSEPTRLRTDLLRGCESKESRPRKGNDGRQLPSCTATFREDRLKSLLVGSVQDEIL